MEEVESEKFRDYQNSPNLAGRKLEATQLWPTDPEQLGKRLA